MISHACEVAHIILRLTQSVQAGKATNLIVARGDLSNAPALGQAMQGCQLVIHVAAKVGFE